MDDDSHDRIVRHFAAKASLAKREETLRSLRAQTQQVEERIVTAMAEVAAARAELTPADTQLAKRFKLPVAYTPAAAPEEDCCTLCDSQDQAKFDAIPLFERGMQQGPMKLEPPYLCPWDETSRCPRRPVPAE